MTEQIKTQRARLDEIINEWAHHRMSLDIRSADGLIKELLRVFPELVEPDDIAIVLLDGGMPATVLRDIIAFFVERGRVYH